MKITDFYFILFYFIFMFETEGRHHYDILARPSGLISPCRLDLVTANTSQFVWLTFTRAQLTKGSHLVWPNEHLNINFNVSCTYTVVTSLPLWHTGDAVHYVSVRQTNPSWEKREERALLWTTHASHHDFFYAEIFLSCPFFFFFLTRRLLCVCWSALSLSFSNLLAIW